MSSFDGFMNEQLASPLLQLPHPVLQCILHSLSLRYAAVFRQLCRKTLQLCPDSIYSVATLELNDQRTQGEQVRQFMTDPRHRQVKVLIIDSRDGAVDFLVDHLSDLFHTALPHPTTPQRALVLRNVAVRVETIDAINYLTNLQLLRFPVTNRNSIGTVRLIQQLLELLEGLDDVMIDNISSDLLAAFMCLIRDRGPMKSMKRITVTRAIFQDQGDYLDASRLAQTFPNLESLSLAICDRGTFSAGKKLPALVDFKSISELRNLNLLSITNASIPPIAAPGNAVIPPYLTVLRLLACENMNNGDLWTGTIHLAELSVPYSSVVTVNYLRSLPAGAPLRRLDVSNTDAVCDELIDFLSERSYPIRFLFARSNCGRIDHYNFEVWLVRHRIYYPGILTDVSTVDNQGRRRARQNLAFITRCKKAIVKRFK